MKLTCSFVLYILSLNQLQQKKQTNINDVKNYKRNIEKGEKHVFFTEWKKNLLRTYLY
jgi:hypothetical protein